MCSWLGVWAGLGLGRLGLGLGRLGLGLGWLGLGLGLGLG